MSDAGEAGAASAAGAATRRWLYIWIAIGIVIVLVVIGFLIPISSSLRSIDSGLDHTLPPVKGVRSDVDPLTADIDRVNGSLAQISTQLRPLHHQAHLVIGNLDTIDTSLTHSEGALSYTHRTLGHTNGELANTSSALKSTSGNLTDAEASLNTTSQRLADVAGTLATLSGTLHTTLSLSGAIEHTLVRAEVPRSQGTGAIWRRVRVLNGGSFDSHSRPNDKGLRAIDTTGGRITTALVDVNGHLQSICESVPLRTLSQLGGGSPTPTPTAPARC